MQAQILDRDWLTVKQAADYFGKSTRTVHRWLDSGTLPYSQPVRNGSILISVIAIEKMLEIKHH